MTKPSKQSFMLPGGATVEIEDRTSKGDPTVRGEGMLEGGRTGHTGHTTKEALASASSWLRFLTSRLDKMVEEMS
jgi:hypothetical protein